MPVHAVGPSRGTYQYNARAAQWLTANRSRFDGVVVEGLWQYHGFAALQAIRPPQRYMVFTHGMLDPYFNRKYPLKYLKKLPYWLVVERRLLRNAYRVLFTCDTERDLAATSFPLPHWQGQVVPFGTAGPPDGATAQCEAFYAVCPAVRDTPFLLFAARIHEKKGCDLLVEAYGRLSRTLELPPLVIAGPDQTGLRRSLEEQAAKWGVCGPHSLARHAHSATPKWGAFRACEAFVLPSHQENFGIAVAEALSCGKPGADLRPGDICDRIRQQHAGIVAPDTVEGTISLLEQWVRLAQGERNALCINTIPTFRTYFDTQQTARMIVSLFQNPAA